jgi:hypothetical protein
VSGERDLAALIRSMRPALQPGVFVFATLGPGTPMPPRVAPVATFREAEGLTLVVPEAEAAAAGLAATFRCRQITLSVHSSLEAVGFLAAVTRALADAGIGVNPLAAYHHDHLFVPVGRAEEAVRVLETLAAGQPRT